MTRSTSRTAAIATVAVLALAAPSAGQSTGPRHDGFDPNARIEGHYHVGELGEKALVLEQALKCNCGCGLDVHSCQFQMQCGVSPVWAQRIRDALAAGETVEAIQAGFVAEFGTAVLMAPPPEGFNLLGYLLPAIAIVTAGMLVGLIARGGPRTEAPAAAVDVSDEDAERLREALRSLDGGESPDW